MLRGRDEVLALAVGLVLVAIVMVLLFAPYFLANQAEAKVMCEGAEPGALSEIYKVDDANWVKVTVVKEFIVVQQPRTTSSIFAPDTTGIRLEREGKRLCFITRHGDIYVWDIPNGRPWLVFKSVEPTATPTATFDPGSGCQAPDCIGGGGTDEPTATPTFDPGSGCFPSCGGGGGTDVYYPTSTPITPTIVPPK